MFPLIRFHIILSFKITFDIKINNLVNNWILAQLLFINVDIKSMIFCFLVHG